MGRLLLVLALLAAGYLVWNHLGLRGAGTRIEGSSVIVDADQLEATFERGTLTDETWMIFGGLADRPRNSLSHVTLAGLPLPDARMISASHPDFHRCSSPGAAQAKRLVRDRNFVAATDSVWGTLVDTLELFEERLHADGERTCVRVRGADLDLERVRLRENGADITADVRPRMQIRFELAEEAEIVDCQEALAGAG
jgi:hypothetical protein